jgi:predicted homoserine dehydrogenase-like protein
MVIRRLMEELEERGKPIRVAVVGVGAMGAGAMHKMAGMAGIRCSVAADLDVERAVAAGKPVVTDNALIVPELNVDAVLEATGSTSFGARIAYESILAGKHVSMLTVETDVVVGPILARTADSADVVYTLASGDQPGAILEMYHWARTLGFEVVAAGRGEIRYPEDRYQGPHKETRGRPWVSTSPKMENSFRDGTKAQIEMAAVSNSTGLVPDVRGMHAPQVAGGVLGRKGVVETANAVNEEGTLVEEGQVGNGVFLVIDSCHPGDKQLIRHFFSHQGGTGGALYRPYHLTCLEAPMSIARAALFHVETAKPQRLHSELLTLAKKDLAPGEILDGAGGTTVYAQVEKAEITKGENCLPFGFAENVEVLRPVKKDQVLTYQDVEMNRDDFLFTLRRLQDETVR